MSWVRRHVPPPVNPLLTDIQNFVALRGNSITPADILSFFANLPPAQLCALRQYLHYAHNLHPILWLANLSHPLSARGQLLTIEQGSYTRIDWAVGPPRCSGSRLNESHLLNLEWRSEDRRNYSDERKAEKPCRRLLEVTQRIRDAEDECSELHHQIARNRSVYRLLLRANGEAVSTTRIVVNELDQIYKGRGSYVAALVGLNPPATIPVIRDRLRTRFAELYLQKFENTRKWCRIFELEVPRPRVALEFPDVEVLAVELGSAGGSEIKYPVQHTFLLQHFVNKSVAARVLEPGEVEGVENCGKLVVLSLRLTEDRMHCGYEKAAAIVAGSLLLKRLGELRVVDAVEERSGVKIMINMGMTQPEQHGLERVITILAEAGARQSVEAAAKRQVKEAITDIAAQLFEMNYRQAGCLLKLSQAFLRALRLYARAGEGHAWLWVCLRMGTVIIQGEKGEFVDINLDALFS
jgi:hypothetical protein